MNSENKGYLLTLVNQENNQKAEKVYLKPMAFYIADFSAQAVNELLNELDLKDENSPRGILTLTNKNNGVSVDKPLSALSQLQDPALSADMVKELVNIVRGYDTDEETNVCGW